LKTDYTPHSLKQRSVVLNVAKQQTEVD